MAPIKLHGSPLSTATMRALAALHEKELEYEFVEVDMKSGAHKSPEFLALNTFVCGTTQPFGQVPAFEDGDLKLFESRAITRYIALEYASEGTPLVYTDSKKMAIASVWIEVEAQQYDPLASKLCIELCFKPMFGKTTDPAAVEELEAKLGKVLDVYEARLGQSKYLGGDCFSLADLHHLPNLHCLFNTPAKKLFVSRPYVCAWVADITARPAWAKVTARAKVENCCWFSPVTCVCLPSK